MNSRRSFFQKLIGVVFSSAFAKEIVTATPALKISKTVVVAGTRKLKARWSEDAYNEYLRMSENRDTSGHGTA